MRNVLIFFFLFPLVVFSQQKALRHHTFHVVTDKQYDQKIDSSYLAYEVFVGNSNSWTGDNYYKQPSVQFLVTYDNNSDYEFGVFGCINNHSMTTGNPAGVDLFFLHKILTKFTFIADAYTYISNRDSLESSFGYSAKVYTLYTARMEYDVNDKLGFILGYSIFSDKSVSQHFMTLECDYNITDYITLAVSYSTNNDILNLKDGSFGAGVGFLGRIANIGQSPLRFGMTLNPIFNRDYTGTDRSQIPFSIILSLDI